MKEKFSYNFDVLTRILYKNYFGSIKIDDISSSWDYAIENELIPRDVRGFILDYRKGSLDIGPDEYTQIPKYYKSRIAYFGGKKIAIVTEEPKDIVIPTLVQDEDDGYLSRPFSGIEAAVRWILM